MKYLKTKNISKFSISDDAFIYKPSGRFVMDGTGAVRLPKGTTVERPDVDAPVSNNPYGYVRYNTETDSLEAYVKNPVTSLGEWQVVKAPGSRAIIKQTLGPGDDIETNFGPLTLPPADTALASAGSGAVYDYPILVLVENVAQISEDNYDIDFDYLGSGDAWLIFTSPVPLGKNITIYFGLA